MSYRALFNFSSVGLFFYLYFELESVKAEDSEALPRMDARTAESLVSKWQKIKSQAFGRDHCIEILPEVRDKVTIQSIVLKLWTWL